MENINKLRQEMKNKGYDYFLAYSLDPHNSEYVCDHYKITEFLTGFTGDNATVLVSDDKVWLWTDGRYFTQAEIELNGKDITLMRSGNKGVKKLEQILESELSENFVLTINMRLINAESLDKLYDIAEDKGAIIRDDAEIIDSIWQERPEMPAGKVRILPMELAGEGVMDKLFKIREELKRSRLDSCFVSTLDDIMWIFNIRGEDVECNPVAFAYAYITQKKAVLFIQESCITENIKVYAAQNGFKVKAYHKAEKYIGRKIEAGEWICINRKNLNGALALKIEATGAEIVTGPLPSTELKACKNETEIANLKKIFLQDSLAVTRFLYYIDTQADIEALTEVSAAQLLEEYRKEIPEYNQPSFPTIAAYGKNAAMAHYAADEKMPVSLCKKGFFLFDSGGQYEGGTTDVTRTIALGRLTKEERKAFTLVAAGWASLMAAKWPEGCTGRNLDILSRQRLWSAGLDFNHGTGHGVGYMLNVHEGPQAIRWRVTDPQVDGILKPGMLITDEPGMYVAGKYGIRTENTLLVKKAEKTEYGQFLCFESLTLVPIDRRSLDLSLLTAQEIGYINEYHALVYEKLKDFLSEDETRWLKKATAPL